MAASFISGGWIARVRRLAPGIAGLLLTTAGFLMVRHRIASLETDIRGKVRPVEVVVASMPIAPGSVFTESNLAKKPVPSSGTGRRNVPASEFTLLLGSRSRVAIDPGEPVLWTDVEEPFQAETLSLAVPEGRRAMTVEVDAGASFSGLLRPGDRVDLYNPAPPAHWFRDIPVLAVDRHYGRSPAGEESAEVSTVTLSVSPAEGAGIGVALRDGTLRWFLRNPEDRAPLPSHASPPSSPPAVPREIEIWKGGERQASFFPGTGGSR